MWAQEWGNIYPLVAPPGGGGPGFDLDRAAQGQEGATHEGDGPLRRALLHLARLRAAARDLLGALAVHQARRTARWSATPAPGTSTTTTTCASRCASRSTGEDFVTIHHELGHNFYQRAYHKQPFLFRNSANDGFHEAIGDTIALSVTPDYLVKIGLLDTGPGATRATSASCMRMALDKVAFLPFGLLIDQWRWKVFSGEVTPAELQRGVVGAARRSTRASRRRCRAARPTSIPAPSTTCPANVPYTRYFLAHILQFQFHRALCRRPGFTGPAPPLLDLRQQGGGREARTRCWRWAQSRPWPDALEALTGEKQMDATAILDYFAPLKKWLDEQNKGRKVGF